MLRHKQNAIYILKNGDTVKLPLHYEGWTWIMATFTIPIEQAKSLYLMA